MCIPLNKSTAVSARAHACPSDDIGVRTYFHSQHIKPKVFKAWQAVKTHENFTIKRIQKSPFHTNTHMSALEM